MHKAEIALKLIQWQTHALLNRSQPAGTPIFILGTGRSGTHFLTRCLNTHADITDLTDGRENTYVFRDVVTAALNPYEKARLMPGILRKYRFLVRAAAPRHFLDQSHPNIWLAESLAHALPAARFIGIVRDPLSVVYSTLQHSGVKRRLLNWRNYPVPSRFLGIEAEEAEVYEQLSLPERGALRWASHFIQMNQLQESLGDRLKVVRYETLCAEGPQTMAEIAAFLGITDRFAPPQVQAESLTKKTLLSDHDKSMIYRVLAIYLKPEKLHGNLQAWAEEYSRQ